MKNVKLAQLRRKVKRVEEVTGLTLSLEFSGAPNQPSVWICPDGNRDLGTKRLTQMGTSTEVFLWLDLFEDGFDMGHKAGVQKGIQILELSR